ncbi:MAG: dimethyl sulfoxide reductase anchor subunit [Xanthobacteraceae bacterium]|nr:dimethyl sulfoxide reductase anchor subunit [Xanthobacteraceae bacterium]
MHPAYSVIIFTTASGAGYGLLIGLSLAMLFGLPRDPAFGFFALGTAVALVTLGLLASTLHLGRPGRAWRALSQVRTSWLSREGVAAIVTYLPVAALGLGWVFGEFTPGQIAIGAALSVPFAIVTVWCTGKIYATLPTIRAWNQSIVAPIYLVLALATGSLLLGFLLALFGYDVRWAVSASALLLALGCDLKVRYWSAIDRAEKTYTAESATGLGSLGTVRPLDPPHTQPNFVMREMGYQVARRHARKLRILTVALLFVVPLLAAIALLLLRMPNAVTIALTALSVCSAAIGVLTERWLFFAEAEHVVVIYYRGGVA